MNAWLGIKRLLTVGVCIATSVLSVRVDAGLNTNEVPVVINEVLASNSRVLADPQGQFDDWIELHNRGNEAVNLAGLYLTDDPAVPTKWRFPTTHASLTTIAPQGYLIVWADGDTAAAGLHAAFKLDAGGETVALYDRDGASLIDSVTFGPQRTDISYGRIPNGSDSWMLLAIPTPGAQNFTIYEGFVEEPRFSPERGFYGGETLVTITCDTPGAVIYYTTDGTEPYSTATMRLGATAAIYSGPIRVSKTTCLRAVATRPSWSPSPISTSTYFFVADIITQSPQGQRPGPAWPVGSVNGQVIDYGMDPDVVNDARYRDLMADALLSIPSLSLVTDLANLFDPAKGIYVNARNEGSSWERPVSVELIDPEGAEGFQIDAGIRIRGGFSRGGDNAKHSFRLFFRGEYGTSALRYPLFGSEGAQRFENIDLRTAQNYAWSLESSNPGEKNTFVREVFCRDLQRETGQPYTRSRYYHLFINGQYWGLYQSQERSEASYAATYFGGEEEDYDVVKTDNYRTSYTDGSIDDWNLLWALCQHGFGSNDLFYAVQGKNPDGTDNPNMAVHVDLGNLIDYMIGIFYTGNDDAPVTLGGSQANNFFAIRNRTVESRDGWKFFAYDNEHSLGVLRGLYDDRTATVSAGQSREHFNPQWLHQKLMIHPEYYMQFADHAHKHFFNAGVMTPEKAIALCRSRADQIDLAIIAESARWGDRRSARVNNPYTKEDWSKEVHGYLIGTFFPARTEIVLNQFRNRGLYPRVDAPVFRVNGVYQHGGHISPSDALTLAGGGTLWYTLDGSDPRVPGSTPGASDEVLLIPEGAAKRVLVPTGPIPDAWKGGAAFDDSAWIAGVGGVGFERSTGYEMVFQTDVQSVMYSRNASCCLRVPFEAPPADLATLSSLTLKVRYDDGFVVYLNGSEIARKNFTGNPVWNSAANTQNPDEAAVSWEPFDVTPHLDKLQSGQNLLAVHAMNVSTTSSDFLISVELVSAKAPAGGAPTGVSPTASRYTGPIALSSTVVVKSRVLSNGVWSALNEAVFAVGPVSQSLRISEIHYHPEGDPNTEFIELTHIGSQAINLNLVCFVKGVAFTFPSFELSPGGYCLLVRDLAAFEAVYGDKLPVVGQYAGSLDNAGETIELLDAAGQVIQSFEYKDNWFDLTDGLGFSLTMRDPRTGDPGKKNAWQAATPSPGWANP
ncbi:MAG TPA: lamin tail domain-containing protein [Sedimentisphaerales bacterium]|nr:lamin tail domain-containing protein [Sedimentisphaerales bacterium]